MIHSIILSTMAVLMLYRPVSQSVRFTEIYLIMDPAFWPKILN